MPAKDRGYIYIAAEGVGFDNDIFIIVQPRDKFYDFNFRSETNNPEKMTKVRKSYQGAKYIIPAEYDVLVSFAPVSYAFGSESVPIDDGKLKIQVKWIQDTTEYLNDLDTELIERLPPLDSDKDGIPDFEEKFVKPVTDDQLMP